MDILLEYREYLILLGLHFMISGVYIYMPTQAIVYIFGRMLGLANKDRARNSIALVSTILFSAAYIYMNKEFDSKAGYIWEFVHWFSLGILWYVLIGFRLFSRVDNLLDKKVGKDD